MAPPNKDQKFGALPDAVRVRLQARSGGRQTKSFIVFGHTFDAVEECIQTALAESFGQQEESEEEDEGQDTVEFETVRPKAKIRRRK